ncbi:hypothetical protein PAPYR_12583 [Paratrimastix pyriformis]|uniref:Uncharacterized protein n=1 Tax=Paratrimastix pyriformis TaxID=342808 RepID=A0ABQ8U8C3_9EUKA|nr:hypothetical protein PAPYR_12583 [Paratrimastix pyriformis]
MTPRIFPSGTRQNAEEARKERESPRWTRCRREIIRVEDVPDSAEPEPIPEPRLRLQPPRDRTASRSPELESVHEALSAEALELYGDDYDGEDRDLITNRIEKTFVDL